VDELSAEKFESFRIVALTKLNQTIKIDGFRTGHIPETVLRDHLGEEKILETMAELALQEAYPAILKDEKIDAIGRPEITITKLASGNPLGFKITTAVYPKFDLPDYQTALKIINAEPVATVTVEEKEIADFLARATKNQAENKTNPPPLPTREQIKNYLTQEKIQAEQDKRRVKILDELISHTTMALPKILVETELNKMLEEMKANIVNLGGKFEDYLTHLKKTEAELKTDWQESAIKRVKSGLILEAIAAKEKIAPKTETVEIEVKHLLEHYPKVSASWRTDGARTYVVNRLTNEEVLKYLESIK